MEKKDSQPQPPIAIIGIGCLFPKSPGAKSYWRLIYRGEDAVTDVPSSHWSPTDYFSENPKTPDHVYCKRGGFLSPVNFDPSEFGIPPNVLEATDTSQLLGLLVAKMAMADAGYDGDKSFDRDRTSVIIGVTGTQELVIPLGARLGHPKWRKAMLDAGLDPETTEEIVERIGEAYVPWQENSFPGLLGNVVAGRICNKLDFGGTNCVVDAACASSMGAIHLAQMELTTRRSDMVLTGGADTINDIFMHMCFSRTQILSATGNAKPFSEDADGTVLGEGIGMVVLKRLEDAEADGDRIYAVVRGMGSSSDGKSQSIYAPRAEGQAKALRRAYQSADVDPQTVELIETHGTGTRVGDRVEVEALKMVFDQPSGKASAIAFGSVKSMIGHTKAAAGVAGLIKTVLALHNKVLPPTLKVSRPDPLLHLEDSTLFVNTETLPWVSSGRAPRRAGVSAFGFGGSNYHMVLEEYRSEKTNISWDGSVEIFAFSGNSPDEITGRVHTLYQNVRQDHPITSQEIARLAEESRNSFSAEHPLRLLFSCHIPLEPAGTWLSDRLQTVLSAFSSHDNNRCWQEKDIFFGIGDTPGGLAFMFPGQGSQYVGMGRDLATMFPAALKRLESADSVFDTPRSISSAIYPMPAGDGEAKRRQEERLRQTNTAQPAIGAVSAGMMDILDHFGIVPDAACGHSYGELTALLSSGRISNEDFHRLSAIRGRLMVDAGRNAPNGDCGTMLAVKAPLETLDDLATEFEDDVTLANRNSPEQGVFSGPTHAMDRLENRCREIGLRAVRLPVSAAFHSPLVSGAVGPFLEELENIRFSKGKIPVYANTSAAPYPDTDREVRDWLSGQLAKPVDFLGCIRNMAADGYRTFVEVGPKAVLTGLVRAILAKESGCHVISIDSGSGQGSGTLRLAACLCHLASLGYPVKLTGWEDPAIPRKRQRMSIPISGANYQPPRNTPKKPKSRKSVPAPVPPPVAAPTQENRPISTHGQPKETTTPKIPDTTMKKSAIPPSASAQVAMQTIREALQSLQTLQAQTAEVHKRFLDNQTENSRALQSMMEKAAALAGVPMNENISIPPDAPSVVGSPQPVRPRSHETPAPIPEKASVQPETPSPSPDPQEAEPEEAADGARAHLEDTLLSVVAELTGYPQEMLDADMDIEADLGIDSIKRVEILSTLEERMPHLPSVAPDVMGAMKTLREIIVHMAGGLPPAAIEASEPSAPAAVAETDGELESTLLSVVAELTGYPQEMLDADMDIEADLGIDSIKRVEILSTLEERMPHLPSVAPDVMGAMKTLREIIAHMAGGLSSVATEASEPSEPAAVAETDGELESTLLSVVADLTGYPQEMLDADMDIEADLGIDSIKRVEILSTLEERLPHLPSVAPDVMGSLKTLGDIVTYLHSTGPEGIPGESAPPAHTPEQTDASTPSVGEKPALTTGPDMDLPERRIVCLKPSKRPQPSNRIPGGAPFWITEEPSGLSEEVANVLRASGVAAEILNADRMADLVSGNDLPAKLAGLLFVYPNDAEHPEKQLETALLLAKASAASLARAATGKERPVFATLTQMDGAFGFHGLPVASPESGGLAGLVKTAAIEWESVTCKALDASGTWPSMNELAEAVAGELLAADPDEGIEIGLEPGSRATVETAIAAYPEGEPALTPNDVIVVTGGGRGISAEIAEIIAERYQPICILLGRTASPAPEPAWLSGLSDAAEIKKAILTHEFAGRKPSPAQIEASFRKHSANRTIAETLEKIAQHGSAAAYYSVDVRDERAVRAVFETIRDTYGPVTGVIHGAGTLEDRYIVDKTAEQFRSVYDTKVAGLKNLLRATADDSLKYLILFSSVSARYGNKGQADYAMANEALNKIAATLANENTDCRVLSINWGPWDGGMVTPSLKREFVRNGVPLISVRAGAESLIREMAGDDPGQVEVVIGSGLDSLTPPSPVAEKPAADEPDRWVTFRREIGVHNHPVLESHILDGRPVVPFALMGEWLGHGALHDNPGLLLHGLDDWRVLNGIVLPEAGARMPIRLMAGKARKKGTVFEVDVDLRNGTDKMHAKARAVLCSKLPQPPEPEGWESIAAKPYTRSIEEAYDSILFHGPRLQGIREIVGWSAGGMVAKLTSAPSPSKWIHEPLRGRWIADPLVLDSAFQMSILWCFEEKGVVSLPTYAASFRQFKKQFPNDGVTAILKVTSATDAKMQGDFLFVDGKGEMVAQLSGFEAAMNPSLFKAFKRRYAA